jgi:threonine aldolase
MTAETIDLRSDTMTRPTPEMRRAMAQAPVGDDVFGEDPTIIALQERVADMLGKEAAIYVPSGTMSNQIGLRLHCAPGDEFLCEADCHIYNYEQAIYAQLCGIAARPIAGRRNVLSRAEVENMIRSHDDHAPRTRLLALENTHNRGSGCIQPQATVVDVCRWAHDNGLATHLDGARLFNAAVASKTSPAVLAEPFDTLSVCFSKGLGAPVGSALAGSKDDIRRARRHRKAFGGGMRQAGIIAAGALYALDNHVERLADDHANARILADAIRSSEALRIAPESIDTNIVIFEVDPGACSAAALVAALREKGVLMLTTSKTSIRAVTHLDVSTEQIRRAAEILLETVDRAVPQAVAPDPSTEY